MTIETRKQFELSGEVEPQRPSKLAGEGSPTANASSDGKSIRNRMDYAPIVLAMLAGLVLFVSLQLLHIPPTTYLSP